MALIKAKIRFGYTPSVDKLMILYGLMQEKVKADGFTFHYVLDELENLNKRILRSDIEAGIVSTFTYFHAADKYTLLPCAAAIGHNYGPILVSKQSLYPKDLTSKTVAVPGLTTAAYLAARLFLPAFKAVEIPSDKIGQAVLTGEVDAGVLIDVDQMSYEKNGLRKIADFGEWFYEMTKLPFPYQVCLIRKSLGRDVMRKFTKIMESSVHYALKNRASVVEHALREAKSVDTEATVQYLDRYVDEYTLSMGKKTKEALGILQKAAHDAGLVKDLKAIEFVSM